MVDKVTFNISKENNFSDWFSEILNKAEISDLRYNVKGFIVIRPWGALIIEKMYKIYEQALQETGHLPAIFPAVIPEKNFKKESGHVKGFTPQVFWLKDIGEGKLALRPTSETAFYQMYALWIRSWRDLPLKIYQRANVFRYETKATRPLIRGREFYWIEAHDVFATKEQAEEQVQDDIRMTERIMHQVFGVPFLPMKRPEWDKFPGADYTIGSDSILPDGRMIQQPSTHLLGQNFSKPFNVKFKNEDGEEKFAWQTTYGPAMSRILASILALHGDNNGLVLPFAISPIQVVIIPIYTEKNEKNIKKQAELIKERLKSAGIDVYVDSTDKRPGEKFFYWEMKGIPFRIEIGEKEISKKEIILFRRDTRKKLNLKLNNHLADGIKNLGKEFDKKLIKKADSILKNSIQNCKTREEIKRALNSKKIARFSFCSSSKKGEKCAAYIEKELQARVMGTRADIKEKPEGKCVICGNKADEIVYAGKSY